MNEKCKTINHPNIMPGWGCCMCRTYNGIQRKQCKQCGHECCVDSDGPKDTDIN